MITYFGESWSSVTENSQQIPTPVESKCCFCEEGFVKGDQGIAIPAGEFISLSYFHKNCFLRTIVGSVGHQRKQCSCHGGTLEDPQELSLREAANAAVREYEEVARSQESL